MLAEASSVSGAGLDVCMLLALLSPTFLICVTTFAIVYWEKTIFPAQTCSSDFFYGILFPTITACRCKILCCPSNIWLFLGHSIIQNIVQLSTKLEDVYDKRIAAWNINWLRNHYIMIVANQIDSVDLTYLHCGYRIFKLKYYIAIPCVCVRALASDSKGVTVK